MADIYLKKALETNSFTTTQGSIINPEIWVKKIEEHAKAKLVVAQLAKKYDFTDVRGATFKVKFNDELTASELSEDTAITPSAFSYSEVTFTPTEYGVAVAITRKERERAFHDIMNEKTKEMGYALAKKKEQVCFARLQAGAGITVVADGATEGALTSSNTLDTDDIAEAIGKIRANDYEPKYLVIHPYVEKELLKLSNFIDASVYGSREVILNGEIGKFLGLKVLVSSLVPQNSQQAEVRDNFVLADDAFGIVQKMPVTFNSFYKVLEREYILASVEEYDVQVLRPNAIVRLVAWAN